MTYSIITPTYNQLDKLKRIYYRLQNQVADKGRPLDYEWILAIDGSNDGTKEWAEEHHIPYVFVERDGRQYNKVMNMAAKKARGDYLFILAGDTIPQLICLREIDKVQRDHPERIVNGQRLDCDNDLNIVRTDFRLKFMPELKPVIKVKHHEPWKFMTSNVMSLSRGLWEYMGGFNEVYFGYGTVDWDLIMRIHFRTDAEFWWALEAKAYHIDLEDKQDSPANQAQFMKTFYELSKEKTKRVNLKELLCK